MEQGMLPHVFEKKMKGEDDCHNYGSGKNKKILKYLIKISRPPTQFLILGV